MSHYTRACINYQWSHDNNIIYCNITDYKIEVITILLLVVGCPSVAIFRRLNLKGGMEGGVLRSRQ